ncbi:MAG: hypothetical protein AABX19_00760 [Nanoarchaeota archaeon]
MRDFSSWKSRYFRLASVTLFDYLLNKDDNIPRPIYKPRPRTLDSIVDITLD